MLFFRKRKAEADERRQRETERIRMETLQKMEVARASLRKANLKFDDDSIAYNIAQALGGEKRGK
jgi:hypothetical protein